MLSHRNNITLADRPVYRHYKTGIIERKHRTVERILERLLHESSFAPDSVLLARSIFLSNNFHGSHSISAFELVSGYMPALFDTKSNLLPQALLEFYDDQQSFRALQRLLISGHSKTPYSQLLSPWTPAYYY